MILLIDNYDSFTYNLAQQIGALGAEVQIIRNDMLSLAAIRQLNPTAIVLSPGPGTPDDAGICLDIVTYLSDDYPILGICLGHQTIAQAFGGKIVRAQQIMHGRTSTLEHDGAGLLTQVSASSSVMRYHSLVVEQQSFPHSHLLIHATAEDGEIMAIKHRTKEVYGLQFHPESFGTAEGDQMISNFLHSLTVIK
ncbi:anthranilate synthase component II [Kurthia sibirica]|uniref:Aminodeoxychorismate/anthranilate synthase component II n=1 Tax=Kurthia sibirica TaxID=202750 RepID=A0A2U3AN33_9BACL|nr:aminodeoxychorismate/anthranilate synthase component II [Kurthia sibirica]PWI25926.1 aminodeoxychorismate/anthranilate synthase component II [Kurthia sibirica]GEK34282.1 aminodeoxychorismate/anthranilate synthase component II [Kurthia sibirica]